MMGVSFSFGGSRRTRQRSTLHRKSNKHIDQQLRTRFDMLLHQPQRYDLNGGALLTE